MWCFLYQPLKLGNAGALPCEDAGKVGLIAQPVACHAIHPAREMRLKLRAAKFFV